jgi:hypothetical protein
LPRRIAPRKCRVADRRRCRAEAGDKGEIRKTNPIWPGRRRECAKQTQFGPAGGAGRRKSCETNPISPRCRWLPEGIVQNKAKLGGTGGYRQRQLSCGPWLGREVKRAKQTQSARPGPGSSKSEARNPKQIPMANDTNGGRQVKCEGLGPLNFGDWSLFRISRFVLRVWPLGAGGGRRRQNVQNEPNFARPGPVPDGKCAKRTKI